MDINGKWVLLTGASGGLGRAIAKAFASAGAHLILAGRNREKLQAVRATLTGTEHQIVTVDLNTHEGQQQLRSQTACLPVDILINNAGVNYLQWYSDASEDDINAQLQINLVVPMQLTRLMLPILQARDEAMIVNIGSILGSIGFAGSVAYSASKFGLRGFSEALRRELAETSVRVMYFAPRAINTPIHTDQMQSLNTELGNTVDAPDKVAKVLLSQIRRAYPHNHYLGWPETFFVRLNSLLPKLVDKALKKQLSTIKRFSRV